MQVHKRQSSRKVRPKQPNKVLLNTDSTTGDSSTAQRLSPGLEEIQERKVAPLTMSTKATQKAGDLSSGTGREVDLP